jgi:hypothetical protein
MSRANEVGMMNVEDDGLFHINGIDAETGEPFMPPISTGEAIALATGRRLKFGPGPVLRAWRTVCSGVGRLFVGGPLLGARDDVDLTDPRSAGWSVVVASDAPLEAKAAANRLFEHRLAQTGVPEGRCKLFEYPAGRPLRNWLARIGAHASDIDPTRLPYYVTLFGSPTAISFEAQSLLNTHYAVGRLAFDEPDAYARYVASLIEYENSTTVPTAREVAFWGTKNRGDAATRLSSEFLIRPLFEGLATADNQPEDRPIAKERGFRSLCVVGADATRASLIDLLHRKPGTNRPAVLFTASHGLGWREPHDDQETHQGALVCQDWPGLGTQPSMKHCLGQSDISVDANIHGLIAFLFACFGAGTPATSHFPNTRGREPVALSKRPFVAALPQRLLSHPAGAALAVVGHVDLAWACSIRPPAIGPSIYPFRNFLSKVMRGWPVGHATRDFSDRASSAASYLADALSVGDRPEDIDLATAWIERNDSRNYILLGDPAARLRIDEMS